ncbi:MAG: DUF3147 family protein [Verrucomicrobiales bacterium]
MLPVWLKYLITAGLIVGVSELAKRADRLGAAVGALPWMTTLVMIWLYVEKQPSAKIENHAWYTFWYVLPTMPMFLLIPWLLKKGMGFPLVMVLSALVTVAAFFLTAAILRKFGINLY